jgi:hypothetical protein
MLVFTAAWAVDVGQAHEDSLDVAVAIAQGKVQAAFHVDAQRPGQVKVTSLDVDLHTDLR